MPSYVLVFCGTFLVLAEEHGDEVVLLAYKVHLHQWKAYSHTYSLSSPAIFSSFHHPSTITSSIIPLTSSVPTFSSVLLNLPSSPTTFSFNLRSAVPSSVAPFVTNVFVH